VWLLLVVEVAEIITGQPGVGVVLGIKIIIQLRPETATQS